MIPITFIDKLASDPADLEKMEFFDTVMENEADLRSTLVNKLKSYGLNRQQARVVSLRVFDELTFSEIAKRAGITNAQGAFYVYSGAIRHLKEKGYK